MRIFSIVAIYLFALSAHAQVGKQLELEVHKFLLDRRMPLVCTIQMERGLPKQSLTYATLTCSGSETAILQKPSSSLSPDTALVAMLDVLKKHGYSVQALSENYFFAQRQ